MNPLAFLKLVAEYLRTLKEKKNLSFVSKRERLYGTSLIFLGKDASPLDEADDAVGCMDTVTALIAEVDPSIKWKNRLSTLFCEKDMRNGAHFFEVKYPEPGDVVMSATAGNQVGHVGIVFPNEKIASNSSDSGLFDVNYSFGSWERYFVQKKGLKMRFYRLL